jgi:predicted amidohydrolase
MMQLLPAALPEISGLWTAWSPMPALSPEFGVEPGAGGVDSACLRISGGGNRYQFGAWTRRVPARPGAAYRLRVAFRCRGIDALGLHVTPHIVWRRGEHLEEQCAADAVRQLRRERDHFTGEDVFVAPPECDAAEVRLLLRYAPEGEVWFDAVSLEETEPPRPRRVRVGTMRGRPFYPAAPEDHIRYYAAQIDRLASGRPDLVLLPEFANIAALPQQRGTALRDAAERIPGPFCGMLAAAARQYRCYVASGLLEQEGDHVFNAALLFDREGRLVGKQRKIHPYWPEEPLGVSPGETFEVFPTDFGVVGCMICYDSWWPESARLLALKGAELILFPNAGYEERILPARAIDNNVYVVAATLYSPAAIVDTRGELLAHSVVDNVLLAEIDLANRPKCHPNAGGNLNPGPGGARWARNALSTRVDEEILSWQLQAPGSRLHTEADGRSCA